MDVLRKELNAIYELQQLEDKQLSADSLAITKDRAKILADITGGCTVITDASCDRCYIFSTGLGALLGLTDCINFYKEVDSSDEDEIYNRIHPEDLVEKRMLEYMFLKSVHELRPDKKTQRKATCRIRMQDRDGEYRFIDNSTQVIELSPDGKIWLILCCYTLSPNQSRAEDIEARIIDCVTGTITDISFVEKKKHILTEREKEILRLIKDGKASKQIADILGISIYTVNRHRQNIIEKLSVGNSVEAVSAATAMKLL